MVSKDWLPRVLEESRARGFLGPNAIEPHFTHSLGFALCWEERHTAPPACFLDLGSGGGLPGLFLLDRWRCRAVFTDSMVKRAKFLEEALESEGAPGNGTVITARVEEIARIPELVEAFDLVTARSFGPPAVTAECGAQFLKVGGVLIVSEPPDDSEEGRWNPARLELLGLVAEGRVRRGAAYQVLVKTHSTPSEYPRSVGTPRKRPLF
jgi:16S rRNA (guanine527-N7)-methyltransferase